MNKWLVSSWAVRLILAWTYASTLPFKFGGDPKTVYIFTQLGSEPWGRIGLAVIELAVVIALLWPRFSLIGAFTSIVLMIGAIFSHFFAIGINVQGDGGALFYTALFTFVASCFVTWLHWKGPLRK